MTLISTITPCYKMRKYLPLFLEDLPKQTIFNKMEVVLDHNDPCLDEIEMVRSFQKKYPNRLKHIITSPVEPISVSMNTCIKNSSSELLAIWNVDDLRCKDSIENQYKHSIFNESHGLIHGNFVIVNSHGSKHGRLVDHSEHVDGSPGTMFSYVFGPFFAFKKNLTNKIGLFDEQFKTGADYDFCMRLVRTTKVGFVPGVLGYYLDEGRGASTRGDGLQPLERTVVELRYNLLDKIEHKYIENAKKYDIKHIINNGIKYELKI